MAENKYDLLLGPKRDSNLRIAHQPWYRERLVSKYKYDRKPALDTSTWTFLRDGLDDFRDRKPVVYDTLLKENRDFTTSSFVLPPVISSAGATRSSSKSEPSKNRPFTKHEAIYSKTIPNQEKRRRKVQHIESSLLSHPLALHPELGESLPPDVYENIIGLLDPILCASDEQPVPSAIEKSPGKKSPLKETRKDDVKEPISTDSHSPEPIPGYKKAVRNIFGKSDKNQKEETIKEETLKARSDRLKTVMLNNSRQERRTTINNSRQERRKTICINPTAALSKIDYVTKDFCEWVKDFGGDYNNIEEDALKILFATETANPGAVKPVQVVELTNVPPELRDKKNPLQNCEISMADSHEDASSPKEKDKVVYGAWYLQPDAWKVRPAHEKLKDPEELERQKASQMRQMSLELDEELSTLHGAQSFLQFVTRKGYDRRPEFLQGVKPAHEEEKPESVKIVRNPPMITKTNAPRKSVMYQLV